MSCGLELVVLFVAAFLEISQEVWKLGKYTYLFVALEESAGDDQQATFHYEFTVHSEDPF